VFGQINCGTVSISASFPQVHVGIIYHCIAIILLHLSSLTLYLYVLTWFPFFRLYPNLRNTTDSECDNDTDNECVISDDDVENGFDSCDDDDVNSDEEAIRFDVETAIPAVSAAARNQAVKDAADFYHPDNIITAACACCDEDDVMKKRKQFPLSDELIAVLKAQLTWSICLFSYY